MLGLSLSQLPTAYVERNIDGVTTWGEAASSQHAAQLSNQRKRLRRRETRDRKGKIEDSSLFLRKMYLQKKLSYLRIYSLQIYIP